MIQKFYSKCVYIINISSHKNPRFTSKTFKRRFELGIEENNFHSLANPLHGLHSIIIPTGTISVPFKTTRNNSYLPLSEVA